MISKEFFCVQGIRTVLDHLVPDKMNIFVLSTNHKEQIEYEKKEKWFGTLYTDRGESHLKKNQFIQNKSFLVSQILLLHKHMLQYLDGFQK